MKIYKYMRALDDSICEQKNECKEYSGAKISKRLKKMLEGSRIYLSDPKDFNDPFDGYFSIKCGTEQDKRDMKAILEKKIEQFKIAEEKARELREGIFSQLPLENFRVACFSADGKNDLMWAHYADEHNGVCLVYEIDQLIAENGCALFVERGDSSCSYGGDKVKFLFDKVIYSDNKLPLEILDGKTTKEYNIANPMYTKSKIWAYEQEIRLVAMLPYGQAFGDNTYFCQIDKSCLKEIRFGLRLNREYRSEIQKIVQNAGYTDAAFKEAKINTTDFALKIEAYDE